MRALLGPLFFALLAVACTDRSPEPLPIATAASRQSDSRDAVTPGAKAVEPHVPTIVLDPGHGGPEVGAANYGVVEKDSKLDFVLRIDRMLAAEGVRVVLTRREDVRASADAASGEPSFGATGRDLQARIDTANEAEADLFLSVHSNGSTDSSLVGVEVWYSPSREFGETNQLLAETLQARVLAALVGYGYKAVDRGIKDDTCFRIRGDRCFTLFCARAATHDDA